VTLSAPSFAIRGALRPGFAGARRGRDLLVMDGRIRALGFAAARSEGVPTFHLRDDWVVLPAFRDPHTHLLGLAAASLSLDCRAERVPTVAAALVLLLGAAATSLPGSWIRMAGFDDALVAERRLPTAMELDAAAGDHPVVLRHRTGHGVVLNSRAVAALGDRDLRPGELVDPAALPDHLHPLSRADLERALGECTTALARAGVVAVGDATADNDVSRLELLVDLVSRGVVAQDVTFMPGAEQLEAFVRAGRRFGDRFGRLRIGHAKILPRHGDDAWLQAAVAAAHGAGWPVAIHVLDPAELDVALSALTRSGRPDGLPRDRLEHVASCLPDQIDAVGAAGVDVVSNPAFLAARGVKYVRELTPLERDWLYPVRSLRARGVRVAAASDCPVTDALPMDSVRGAVLRGAGATRFAPGEAVDVAAAFAMVTEDAARVMGGGSGRIEAGAAADLVVLDRDPLLAGIDGPAEIEVLGTFRAGLPLFASDALLARRVDGRSSAGLTEDAGALLF
jgi:predicted amidohydrolase YtcJ